MDRAGHACDQCVALIPHMFSVKILELILGFFLCHLLSGLSSRIGSFASIDQDTLLLRSADYQPRLWRKKVCLRAARCSLRRQADFINSANGTKWCCAFGSGPVVFVVTHEGSLGRLGPVTTRGCCDVLIQTFCAHIFPMLWKTCLFVVLPGAGADGNPPRSFAWFSLTSSWSSFRPPRSPRCSTRPLHFPGITDPLPPIPLLQIH